MTRTAFSGISAALLGIGATLCAANPVHADATRTTPLARLFPYLEHYYRMAPAERDSFRLVYRLRKPAPALPPALDHPARRTPTPTHGQGVEQQPPDPAMLRDGLFETTARPDQKFSIRMSPEPVVALAASMPTAPSNEAVAEISAGIRRFAGVLGFAAPRLSGVSFDGVRSGEAVFADGRRVPLPMAAGKPVYRPATPAMRGAVRLEFPNAPTDVDFAD